MFFLGAMGNKYGSGEAAQATNTMIALCVGEKFSLIQKRCTDLWAIHKTECSGYASCVEVDDESRREGNLH